MIAPIMCTRNDGKINDDVYVAYQSRCEDGSLVRMWIGTRTCGPILQYDADGTNKWDGFQRKDFPRGAWTPCYSHGNFGRKYACGGTWSSHNITVCRDESRTETNEAKLVALPNGFVPVPDGMEHDIACTEIIPKDSWAIWFATAKGAFDKRIKPGQKCDLPDRAKPKESEEILERVAEVISAHGLDGTK